MAGKLQNLLKDSCVNFRDLFSVRKDSGMIAELFYTQKLRKLIKDLQEEDDLNEDAVFAIQDYVVKSLVGVFLIVFVFIVSAEVSIATVILLLGPIVIWFDIRKYYFDKLFAYLCGQRKSAIVLRKISMMYFRVKLVCKGSDNTKVVMGPFRELWKASFCPVEQQKITYFDPGNKVGKPMPDIPQISSRYCLRKSMLEGDGKK